MNDSTNGFGIWDELENYTEPKQEEKDALIKKLQSGDFTLSYSSLKAFSVSPRNFISYKLKEYKETPAMIMGNVVHCLVLEPDIYKDLYYEAPVVNAATVEGKKAWAELYTKLTEKEFPLNQKGTPIIPKVGDLIAMIKEETTERDEKGKTTKRGITVIPGTQSEEAKFRARMLLQNEATRWVINQITQTEVDTEFDICGVKFKGRIDGLGPGLIADIKNIPDASIHPAVGQIYRGKMYWQAYCYDIATGGDSDCYILAVDGNGETSVHRFQDRHKEKAEVEMIEYVQQFLDCVERSHFDPAIWDQSQDYWLRSENNPYGINNL